MATTTSPASPSLASRGTSTLGTSTLRSAAKSTNGKRRELQIPLPEFLTFKVRLEGTTPLITDSFSEDAKRKLAESQSGAAKVKPGPRDPQREFENSIYRLTDGGYGIPKLAFRKAIQSGAMRMTDIKGTEVLAAFQIDTPDELLSLDTQEPRMRTDHVVRMGHGNLAYRAEFFPWAVTLPIKLDEEVVSLDQLIHVLAKAGMGVGVGNWRPEKKGDSGLWQVTQIIDAEIHGGEVK